MENISAFQLEYRDLNFVIQLERAINHKPIERWHILTAEDKELLNKNIMGYFNILIESSKSEERAQHYIPAVLLPLEEEEQASDLEYLLLEDGLLDEILEYWTLKNSLLDKPKWS